MEPFKFLPSLLSRVTSINNHVSSHKQGLIRQNFWIGGAMMDQNNLVGSFFLLVPLDFLQLFVYLSAK
jgi:hypothetical protein